MHFPVLSFIPACVTLHGFLYAVAERLASGVSYVCSVPVNVTGPISAADSKSHLATAK
jgi:hypothetical protein